ncbi:hypothetical protein EJ04DRAFT_515318 [Polyplosphaeria fusca]|uniref:Uncharacterized protein n=1 Tax=Polyplosphaeria fusca TaxID=682080 RepID=A0A9P4UXG4_9PLEO|nr:hypothetical protein EJ04DRAFT_515318 [Polyplosphaeria fusca]
MQRARPALPSLPLLTARRRLLRPNNIIAPAYAPPPSPALQAFSPIVSLHQAQYQSAPSLPFAVPTRAFSTNSTMPPALFVAALKDAGLWDQDWGFVIYRATFDDEAAWLRFKHALSTLDALEATYADQEDMQVARARWRCNFVEERSLDGKGALEIHEHYMSIWEQQAPGVQLPICLAVTKDALDSFERQRQRQQEADKAAVVEQAESSSCAFVKVVYMPMAVDEGEDGESEDPVPRMFNSALPSLVDELFPIAVRSIMNMDKLDPNDEGKVFVAVGLTQDVGGSG